MCSYDLQHLWHFVAVTKTRHNTLEKAGVKSCLEFLLGPFSEALGRRGEGSPVVMCVDAWSSAWATVDVDDRVREAGASLTITV